VARRDSGNSDGSIHVSKSDMLVQEQVSRRTKLPRLGLYEVASPCPARMTGLKRMKLPFGPV